MPVFKHDWPSAEEAYIRSLDRGKRESLKTISIRYHIPYQSVRRYAAKHKWVSRRDELSYQRLMVRLQHMRQHSYSRKAMRP